MAIHRADCRQGEPFCLPPESLAAHRLWLTTNGGLGTRLVLPGDHPGANLTGTDLRKADLRGVNLRGADLTGAKLQGADLTGAKLHDANLTNADLTDAHGLCENKTGGAYLLGGANLSGATLPEDVAKFAGLSNVEELSKNAGKLFISMLSADAFMQLIIARTTDAQLMTDAGTTKIPILDADIPITTLFWLGPLVLYGLYFAFHLYLQRLWETLASLPAIFPDGMLLPQKSYPWLLNDMVVLWSPHLKTRTLRLANSQVILFAFLAYWLVPMSLFPFWARYLFRHDWEVTAVHILLLTVFLWTEMTFFYHASATLRRDWVESDWGRASWWKHDWWKHDWWKHGGRAHAMLCLVWGGLFLAVSAYAITWGVPRELYTEAPPTPQKDPDDPAKIIDSNITKVWHTHRQPDLAVYNLRRWVPRLLGEIGYSPFFSNPEQEYLSAKPDGWTDMDGDKINLVRKPARLKNTNLRYADLSDAFLVKADLSDADLEGANLQAADLRGAEIEGANLQGADLRQAKLRSQNMVTTKMVKVNLKETLLEGADLSQVDMDDAQLQGADLNPVVVDGAFVKTKLEAADLQHADLSDAKLQKANLYTAILDGANLTRADLQSADVRSASLKGVNLREAVLTDALLQGADLTDAHLEDTKLMHIKAGSDSDQATILSGANLQGANLYLADLGGANLENAHLEGAKMQKIDLTGADLTGAHLEKADLTGALLQGIVLTGITYSRDTKWPRGFHPPKSRDSKETKIKPALPALGHHL